jgi:hypothetical protein
MNILMKKSIEGNKYEEMKNGSSRDKSSKSTLLDDWRRRGH